MPQSKKSELQKAIEKNMPERFKEEYTVQDLNDELNRRLFKLDYVGIFDKKREKE